MSETHLITGATGCVGSALVLELLRTTDARVVCLVRPQNDAQAAQERLTQVLESVARSFDLPDVTRRVVTQRCRAVPADVSMAACGTTLDRIGPITEVWHSAALLRFEEGCRDALFAQNVEGTRNVLAASRGLRAAKFNYISTAYVSGTRTGLIRETLAEPGTPVNNVYETSKIRAEQLVAQSGLDYRIMRPSIVVGHSKTSAIINPSGFYTVARKLMQLRKFLERRGELELSADLELEGDPHVPLNLIPIDAVVSAAVRISRSSSPARVFHLTNSQPPSLGRALSEGVAVIGMRGPRLTQQLSSNNPYTEQLNRQLRWFVSYLTIPKDFDRTNTDSVVGPEASRWPIADEGLRRYVAWYLDSQAARQATL